MSWRSITEADILNRLANGEWEDLEAAGETTGAKARLPGILVQVTDQIREAIVQVASNYLGSTGTLPPGAIFHACTIARTALVGSQPTNEGETTPRQREEREAWDYVKAIRSGTITFTNPTPPVEPSSGAYGGDKLLRF